MKPSPILCGRIKTRIGFTTKRVGGGFYRGNNTGSLGAHTQHGNYVIDWRKVRHFVVPDLKNFKLTPFVGRDIYPFDRMHEYEPENPHDRRRFAAAQYLKYWYAQNDREYRYCKDMELAAEEHGSQQ